jgi:uncharacterized membrane protein YesL
LDEKPHLNRHTYVRLTATSWWENLPLVVLAGAVFSLLCVPAVVLLWLGPLLPAIIVGALTIAPGWTALLAQEIDMVEGRKTNISVMLRAFPRFWLRSAGLGLLATLPVFAALLTLPALAQPEIPLVVWMGLAADGFALLLIGSLSIYAYPLLVLHDVNLRDGLRNAFIFAGRYVGNTLGLLSMAVLLGFATAYISSGLLFFWPAFWGMFVVNNCRMVVAEELDSE